MSVTQVIVPGYNSAILENENLWRADQASPNPISGVTLGDDIQQNTSELTVYATIPCGEHSIKISSRYYNSRSYYQVDEYDGSTFVRNLVPSSFEYGTPFGYWSNISLAFGIDNDGHLGYVSVCEYSEHESPNHYWVLQKTNIDRANLYNLLSQVEPPVTYNWQSVPSISGKNGILSLAQIKEEYINDGESISGVSADHFTNLSTENRVDVLIDDALPAPEIGGTTVTVKYTIPTLSTGSYEYCKLVAKKNSMPEGPEDGDKIVNIDPTSISASVKYLRGSTKYYFEIFVKTADGYEAVSNVKSITTGETTDIILFTDEFNTSILKSGWALDAYKEMFSSGSTGWAPTSFASDFLSSYNFLCGNASRRPLSMSNGELLTANETGMTDQTFWIPIERTYINESVIVSFDGKISPIGWSSSYYNYIHIWLAYVDDNNIWHSYDACGEIVTDQQWHNFENEIQPQFPYIDYIGLCCCDGSSHWKNIKVINA